MIRLVVTHGSHAQPSHLPSGRGKTRDSGAFTCQYEVDGWLEDAEKLGIAGSRICEIKKMLAGGERKNDGEASSHDHGQN